MSRNSNANLAVIVNHKKRVIYHLNGALNEKPIVPGHSLTLQTLLSIAEPAHCFPPLDIGGLSQNLLLIWVPLPHDFEHFP